MSLLHLAGQAEAPTRGCTAVAQDAEVSCASGLQARLVGCAALQCVTHVCKQV